MQDKQRAEEEFFGVARENEMLRSRLADSASEIGALREKLSSSNKSFG
jgi:hypothetical protein